MIWDSLLGGAFPDARGRYGTWGGRYVPELLRPALDALERSAREAIGDLGFLAQLDRELEDWVGRPTPLMFAPRLSLCWGARIWLKRDDLVHTGSHAIQHALGQVLLARRRGATHVLADTSAGRHGVAVAACAARAGLDCTVYVGGGEVGTPLSQRIEVLGARVRVVGGEDGGRADAIDAALRAWARDPEQSAYVIGSAVGPHPFPWLVRELQAVVGREARAQALERIGRLPDVVVACVGGGAHAIGLFHPFLRDTSVALLGIEGGGDGSGGLGRHGACLSRGTPGVLHGAYTLVLQDHDGGIVPGRSIASGLDYPGVGPEHALLAEVGRARYESATDDEALDALEEVARREGLLVGADTAHAFAGARRWAAAHPGSVVLVGCSARGDDDVARLEARLGTPVVTG